jgi:hypothetical protein
VTPDPLDGERDPGVSRLLDVLASPPTDDELAGERSALAMFVAARDAPAQPTLERAWEPAPVTPPVAGPAPLAAARPARRRISLRLAAAAAVVALAAGFAAAGYAAVLPAPLQRAAYRLLGFAGVPDSPDHASAAATSPAGGHSHHGPSPSVRPSPTPGSSSSPSPRPSRGGSRSPAPPHHSPSPKPSSPGTPPPGHSPDRLVITTPQQQIAAGDSVQITATLTERGQPISGGALTLVEHTAGQLGWQPVTTATTGQDGQAVLTQPTLTTNASFRVTGPHGVASPPLKIVVIPPLTVSLEPGRSPRRDLLIVDCPLAQPRNVVVLEGSLNQVQWRPLRLHRLHRGGQTAFSVLIRRVSVTYRIVLLATPKHGQSISGPVTVPARSLSVP